MRPKFHQEIVESHHLAGSMGHNYVVIQPTIGPCHRIMLLAHIVN